LPIRLGQQPTTSPALWQGRKAVSALGLSQQQLGITKLYHFYLRSGDFRAANSFCPSAGILPGQEDFCGHEDGGLFSNVFLIDFAVGMITRDHS
jgi:hypothetical protein